MEDRRLALPVEAPVNRLFRVLVPRPLRLWMWRRVMAYQRESARARRARASRARQLVARFVAARRARRLQRVSGPVGLARVKPVFVINLESRPDRLSAFMEDARRLRNDGVERFDAVEDPNGYLGCTASHVACLRLLAATNQVAAMICEDDARFIAQRTEIDVLVEAFLEDDRADVLCLSHRAMRSRPYSSLFLRGAEILTTGCYVAKRRIAAELIDVWERGIDDLARGGDPRLYANDRTWMPLQETHVFVLPIRRVAVQAAGFSDIEGGEVPFAH